MRSCIFYYVVSLSCSVNSLYSVWATWRACRDKACTHCSAIHSGQLDRLKKKKRGKKNLVKRNPPQRAQKKCTMLTVFQIPLIAFITMRESSRFCWAPLQQTTRSQNLPTRVFVPRQNPLDRLNAPRVGRGEEKFFQLSFIPPFSSGKKNIMIKRATGEWEGEKRKRGGSASSVVTWRPSLGFTSDSDLHFILVTKQKQSRFLL